MHHGWMSGDGWPMSPYMLIILFLFWGLVIYAVFIIVRGSKSQNRGRIETEPHETALDILKKRYARGEINKEEYEQIKKELE